jgi:hypothetical protein
VHIYEYIHIKTQQQELRLLPMGHEELHHLEREHAAKAMALKPADYKARADCKARIARGHLLDVAVMARQRVQLEEDLVGDVL